MCLKKVQQATDTSSRFAVNFGPENHHVASFKLEIAERHAKVPFETLFETKYLFAAALIRSPSIKVSFYTKRAGLSSNFNTKKVSHE